MLAPWISTYTGNSFWLDGKGEMPFDLKDMANALANINRFSGHTKKAWSVLQHSLFVYELVPPAYQLEALLHDAHEAYVGDVPSPLKHMPEMAGYREIEKRVEMRLRGHYLLPAEMSPVVKEADLLALRAEAYTWTAYNPEWELPKPNLGHTGALIRLQRAEKHVLIADWIKDVLALLNPLEGGGGC